MFVRHAAEKLEVGCGVFLRRGNTHQSPQFVSKTLAAGADERISVLTRDAEFLWFIARVHFNQKVRQAAHGFCRMG